MHPGNILVAPDGRYIALDFGIVGSLTDYDKRYLAINFFGIFLIAIIIVLLRRILRAAGYHLIRVLKIWKRRCVPCVSRFSINHYRRFRLGWC